MFLLDNLQNQKRMCFLIQRLSYSLGHHIWHVRPVSTECFFWMTEGNGLSLHLIPTRPASSSYHVGRCSRLELGAWRKEACGWKWRRLIRQRSDRRHFPPSESWRSSAGRAGRAWVSTASPPPFAPLLLDPKAEETKGSRAVCLVFSSLSLSGHATGARAQTVRADKIHFLTFIPVWMKRQNEQLLLH